MNYTRLTGRLLSEAVWPATPIDHEARPMNTQQQLATYDVRDLRRIAADLELELGLPETANALRAMAEAVETSMGNQ